MIIAIRIDSHFHWWGLQGTYLKMEFKFEKKLVARIEFNDFNNFALVQSLGSLQLVWKVGMQPSVCCILITTNQFEFRIDIYILIIMFHWKHNFVDGKWFTASISLNIFWLMNRSWLLNSLFYQSQMWWLQEWVEDSGRWFLIRFRLELRK